MGLMWVKLRMHICGLQSWGLSFKPLTFCRKLKWHWKLLRDHRKYYLESERASFILQQQFLFTELGLAPHSGCCDLMHGITASLWFGLAGPLSWQRGSQAKFEWMALCPHVPGHNIQSRSWVKPPLQNKYGAGSLSNPLMPPSVSPLH